MSSYPVHSPVHSPAFTLTITLYTEVIKSREQLVSPYIDSITYHRLNYGLAYPHGPCLCFKFLGLQMGYFLQKVERDVIIIEKALVSLSIIL